MRTENGMIGGETNPDGSWKIVAKCSHCGRGYIAVSQANYRKGIKCLADCSGIVELVDEAEHIAAMNYRDRDAED